MKTFVAGTVLAVLAAQAASVAAQPERPPAPGRVQIETVMRQVFPALVRIFVVSAHYRDGREVKSTGSGSGVIVSPEGHVVTNHHVVGRAVRIWCTLPNREEVDAQLVGSDALGDIAVLKLLPETMRRPVREFPFARWGDSAELEVGQMVFAMGSPGAIAQSVTYGIVSNPSMTLTGGGMVLDGEPVGSLVRWIAHDARIYPGNSGGPLVNTRGEIVGINEIGVAGLGGAIPSNTARDIVARLLEHGFVDRSWTGLQLQTLLRSHEGEQGALVNGVIEGSPAERAGVLPGDRILAVNDRAVQVRYEEQMPELNRLIMEAPIGSTLSLRVLRDGEEISLALQTEARGNVRTEERELPSWGATVRDPSRFDAIAMRLPSTEGVLIAGVRPGGPAGQAKPSLRAGDLIVEVGGARVENGERLRAVSREIADGKEEGTPTVVRFRRDDEELLTVVDIGPEDEPQPIPEARKAWFPADTQVLTKPLAEALGMEGAKGVRLTRLYPQLQGADFRVGDVLTHLDGTEIDASEPAHAERFNTMIRRYRARQKVTVSLARDGERLEVDYTLPRSPRPEREMDKYRDDFLGFAVRDLTVMDRIRGRLPEDQKGVLVVMAQKGGWAWLGGVGVNGIVLSVNGKATDTVAQFRETMGEVERARPESIVFFVKRGIGTRFAEVRPDWSRRE